MPEPAPAVGCAGDLLSVKDTEVDKTVGFELGADDYVTKPVAGTCSLPASGVRAGRR